MTCKTLEPYLRGLEVGNSLGHLNLTLVPLRGKGHGHLEYQLAADAIEAGQLAITEVDQGGHVPELSVISTTDSMVLLLDGEELVGAKQNRILNTTVLLHPRAKMRIPVSCVEQGRWRYTSDKFRPAGCAPPRMRAHKSSAVRRSYQARGRAESDQGEVWNDVANMMAESATHSSTMAMQDVVEQRRESIESYMNALDYPSDTRGVVAAINGNFEALDLFDRPQTLEQVWSRLIGGYAMDAMTKISENNKPFTHKGTQAILDHICEIECTAFPSAGMGEDWRFEAEDIVGQSLVADNVCVHMCAFSNTDNDNRDTRRSRTIAPPHIRRRRRGI